jgi:hypothetical protein
MRREARDRQEQGVGAGLVISGRPAMISHRALTPLEHLRMLAHTRRVCRQNGWPTGEEEGFKIISGKDYSEPEWEDERKARYEQAWTQLTAEERDLLARWRKKHLGPERLDGATP